jgi:hypothetical protein
VSARGVAPGELGGELRGGGNNIGIAANSIPFPLTLAPALLERLASENIRCCGDWLALGRRRHQIFGITAAMVARIDKAVAEVLP